MDINFTGLIKTDCGKKFRIDIFDQLAVGIVECDKFLHDPSFIPSTFSLFKTGDNSYLIQVTSFNPDDDSLETHYRVISEAEAYNYLDNCSLDI